MRGSRLKIPTPALDGTLSAPRRGGNSRYAAGEPQHKCKIRRIRYLVAPTHTAFPSSLHRFASTRSNDASMLWSSFRRHAPSEQTETPTPPTPRLDEVARMGHMPLQQSTRHLDVPAGEARGGTSRPVVVEDTVEEQVVDTGIVATMVAQGAFHWRNIPVVQVRQSRAKRSKKCQTRAPAKRRLDRPRARAIQGAQNDRRETRCSRMNRY